MNRAERRSQAKRRKAIARELVRMEKPEQYHQGFNDGGRSMTRACYAAFTLALHDHGLPPTDIVDIMRDLDDRLFVYAGDDELQQQAYDHAGIVIDFQEVFSNDRITLKEA